MTNVSMQFSQKGMDNLFTLPDEKLILSIRKHPFIIIAPIVTIVLFSILTIGLILFLAENSHIPYMMIAISITFIILLTLDRIETLLVNWYFHIYILTTGKIMELYYKPCAKAKINEVLLDQVRCTEIDIETNGVLNQLLDMGNIIFTFDRPTHQEEFMFTNISSPKTIRHILSSTLNATKISVSDQQNPSWTQDKGIRRFRFIEDIFHRKLIPLT